MYVFLIRKLLVCVLLICTTLSLPGCLTKYGEIHVDVDYYIVNLRPDEILARDRNGEAGIVGFFLESGQTYHFGYHGDMISARGDDEQRGPYIAFDLYIRGQNDRFEQHIGCCEFHPYLVSNYAFAETCFVE